MTTSTIDRARLEELLGEYWEIAFEESSGVAATGNKANRVLHEIRALFYALAAPATAPERKPMHEGEIQAAWLGQDLDEPIPYTFVLGIRSAERFNGIKEQP